MEGHDERLYATYMKRVQRSRTALPCLACQTKLKPREFKRHFQRVHPLCEWANTCCWCLKYTWPPHEKMLHARHLLDCFDGRLRMHAKENKKDGHSRCSAAGIPNSPPPPTKSSDLNRFQTRLAAMSKTTGCNGRSSPCYPCPHSPCSQKVEPGAMERHFRDSHVPFDPAVACVWCDGAFVWPRGQKNRNVEHLSSCFESYSERVKRLEREARKNESRRLEQQRTDDEESWLDVFSHRARSLQGQTFTVRADDAHLPRISCGCPSFVGNLLARDRILPAYAYEHLFLDMDADVFPLPHVTNPIEFEDVVERARYYLDLYCQWNRVREDDDGAYDSEDDDDDDDEEEAEGNGRGKEDTVATWYHVMVSAFAFDRFVRAVREFGSDKVFALPFWCWCDGGKYPEPIFRHHRHMILVVRNGCRFVERCWRKLSRVVHNKQYRKKKRKTEKVGGKKAEAIGSGVEWGCDGMFDDDPLLPEGFYMGRSKKIRTWLHLVNTMRYVSMRRSGCGYDFKGDSLEEDRGGRRKGTRKPKDKTRGGDRHFCFGSDWHCLGSLCLVCVASRSGLQTLLDQENRSRLPDPRCVFRWPSPKNGPWHVRVGDLNTGFHEVLPVKKVWKPVKIISPDDPAAMDCRRRTAFLYLMDGKKLVFERDPSLESLSDSEWRRVQAKEGCEGDDDGSNGYAAAKNLFYDVIADARWKLSRWQQVGLNFGEKYARVLTERLEAACEVLKGVIGSLKREVGSLKVENILLKRENESLKRETESWNVEIESLKRRLWAYENRNDNDGSSGIEERNSGIGGVIINGSVTSVYCNT